jgi:hypothetical protein
MAVTLLVKGTIAYGRLHEFCQNVGRFVEYRQSKHWAVPEVLHGLSGPMNTVLMIFRYVSLTDWEKECAAERSDADYARVASAMPFGVCRFNAFPTPRNACQE